LSFGALTAFGQTPAALAQSVAAKRIELGTQELQRIQKLAAIGVESPARLHQAELDLADAQDYAILEKYLNGNISADGLDESAINDMLTVAQRRFDRQQERIDQAKKLLSEGLVAQSYLTPFEQELTMRQMQLDLANFRAPIMQDALARAKAAEAAPPASAQPTEVREALSPEDLDLATNGIEHYEGDGAFDESKDLVPIELAFARKFDRPLPISADGETDLHRALGFDHRGRVDVAINPQTPEGVWLRHYLEALKIPYYAFTRAIRGKATAAHIHIGPGSTRLTNAD